MSTFFKQTISIAICDDESADLVEMETITSELLEAEGISCDISRFGDAGSLLSAVNGAETFDILLLDVMMENLNGIEPVSCRLRSLRIPQERGGQTQAGH